MEKFYWGYEGLLCAIPGSKIKFSQVNFNNLKVALEGTPQSASMNFCRIFKLIISYM